MARDRRVVGGIEVGRPGPTREETRDKFIGSFEDLTFDEDSYPPTDQGE